MLSSLTMLCKRQMDRPVWSDANPARQVSGGSDLDPAVRTGLAALIGGTAEAVRLARSIVANGNSTADAAST